MEIDHKYIQTVTVQAIEETSVVLLLPDGQTLTWPKDLLPPSIKKDQQLRVILHDKETESQEREALARAVLNEVMKPNNE